MGKRGHTIKHIVYAAAILAAAFLISPFSDRLLSSVLLLEKRHPAYYEYLRPETGQTEMAAEELIRISSDRILKGNRVQKLAKGTAGGVYFRGMEGVLHVAGTAEKTVWIRASKGYLYLSRGSYYINLGYVDDPGVSITFSGLKDGKDTVICKSWGGSYFYVDREDYDCYKLIVRVEKGARVDFRFRPIVFKVSQQDITGDTEQYMVWRGVPGDELTDKDIQIFINSLGQFRDQAACVIVQKDRSVRAFREGREYPAFMDKAGRIVIRDSQ